VIIYPGISKFYFRHEKSPQNNLSAPFWLLFAPVIAIPVLRVAAVFTISSHRPNPLIHLTKDILCGEEYLI
jgi:hypothetical protein